MGSALSPGIDVVSWETSPPFDGEAADLRRCRSPTGRSPMALLYGTSGGIPSSGFNRILVAKSS